MRELKFRAWDTALKSMTYSGLHSIGFDGKLWFGNADITGYPVKVMQYTGLNDANGTEIYEGDIVRHSTSVYGVAVEFTMGAFRISGHTLFNRV